MPAPSPRRARGGGGVAAHEPARAAVAHGRDLPAGPAAPTAWAPRSTTCWPRPRPRGSTRRRTSRARSDASDDAVALVWRVAQEAVRNALRHSGADTLSVTVDGAGDGLVLVVTDDGRGFDPGRRPGRRALRAAWAEQPHRRGRRAARRTLRTRRRHHDPARGPGSETMTHDGTDAAGPLRVVLVDDHAVVRRGLADLLSSAPRHRGRRHRGRRAEARCGRPRGAARRRRHGPADAGHRRRRGDPRDPRRATRTCRSWCSRRSPTASGSSPPSTPGRWATCSRTPTPTT